ncbi:MAG: hypothetical protein ABIG29_03045 [Candidatus Nealsonbacteria bacterium]
MTKKTRTILFAICVFLFSLTAPSVIFYSQGYRFDFETRKIVQTGGLYFKVTPRSAQVYLNGKLIETTSIFTSSSLVENLLPKTYYVEIKKDGFNSWQKNMEVKERQVTEAKNITLIPQNINFVKSIETPLPKYLANATSSDGNKVVKYDDHEIWISFPEEEKDIFLIRFSEKICQVFWLNDYYLIFNVGGKINLDFSPCSKLKVAEIDDRDRLNVIDIAEFKTPEIFWDNANGKLYVSSENTLYVSEGLLP